MPTTYHLPDSLWRQIRARYPGWRREQHPEASEITDAEWRDLYRALDAGIDSWSGWSSKHRSDRDEALELLKLTALEVAADWSSRAKR
jgi:hypothetical protein